MAVSVHVLVYSLSFSLSEVMPSCLPLLCFLNETTQVFHLITQFSHVLCNCLFFERTFCCCFVVGFCFLCLLYPHLLSPFIAVFHTASVFNQDVSKWNTGAVTSMEGSKCTHALSLLLSVATPSVAMFLNIYDNSRVSSDHTSHTFCFLFVFVFCLLQCLLAHQRSILTCPNGIRVR
jgi:surface protein